MLYANAADVIACYRLPLGREPDDAGLKNFPEAVEGRSITTDELASLFMASPEFIGIRQSRIQKPNEIQRVVIGEFDFKMDVAPGWNRIHRGIATNGTYEPHVTREMMNISNLSRYSSIVAPTSVSTAGSPAAAVPRSGSSSPIHAKYGSC